MKPAPFAYHRPESVAEAVELKLRYEGEASILAGGQSLIPMLNFRLARPQALVDLGGLPELDYTFLDQDAVIVGAMRRQRDVELDAAATQRCPTLADALANVAHPAIRNRGTIGGTVAHADASAELPTALMALDGRVVAEGRGGERTISARDFFAFHLTTSLEPDELVTAVVFPDAAAGAGTSFLEIARRHGDYAIAGACAIVRRTSDGLLTDVRLAYSGIAPTPVRAAEAEGGLEGVLPDAAAFAHAGEQAAELVDAIDEEQATVGYRRRLVRTLTARALAQAVERSVPS